MQILTLSYRQRYHVYLRKAGRDGKQSPQDPAFCERQSASQANGLRHSAYRLVPVAFQTLAGGPLQYSPAVWSPETTASTMCAGPQAETKVSRRVTMLVVAETVS